MPGNMRRPLLLLLGLLLLQQGRCFEFVIDGEWEDEMVSFLNQYLCGLFVFNDKKTLSPFSHQRFYVILRYK